MLVLKFILVCLSLLESQWLQCSLHAVKSKQGRNLKYCRVVLPLMVWHIVQKKPIMVLWYNSCFPLQMGIKLKSKTPTSRREYFVQIGNEIRHIQLWTFLVSFLWSIELSGHILCSGWPCLSRELGSDDPQDPSSLTHAVKKKHHIFKTGEKKIIVTFHMHLMMYFLGKSGECRMEEEQMELCNTKH